MPTGQGVTTTNRIEISTRVNGREISADVAVRMHAADFLRHELGLTGTHVGCEQGVCGMCTILLDGAAVKSCLLLAVQLDGRTVATVESFGGDGVPDGLQEAFNRHHALQCGFCTPAFLMVARSLEGRRLTRAEIAEELSGVLCRCTGYEPILRAVEEFLAGSAAALREPEAAA